MSSGDEKKDRGSPTSEKNSPSRQVLLVEDDDSLRSALGHVLVSAKWIVETRGSAEEATSFLKVAAGAWLLITDNHLPGLMGIEFLANIARASEGSLPARPIGAILMSGDLESLRRAGKIGKMLQARGILFSAMEKPFEPNEVLLALEAMAEGART